MEQKFSFHRLRAFSFSTLPPDDESAAVEGEKSPTCGPTAKIVPAAAEFEQQESVRSLMQNTTILVSAKYQNVPQLARVPLTKKNREAYQKRALYPHFIIFMAVVEGAASIVPLGLFI